MQGTEGKCRPSTGLQAYKEGKTSTQGSTQQSDANAKEIKGFLPEMQEKRRKEALAPAAKSNQPPPARKFG